MRIIIEDGKDLPDRKKTRYETSSILLTTYKHRRKQRTRGDEKLSFYLPSTVTNIGENQVRLINRRFFSFLTIMMVFTANIFFIFSYYPENVLAGDIAYSEYKCILTVGTTNDSSIVRTIENEKANTSDDIAQITIIKNKSIYLPFLGFLQKIMDRFPNFEGIFNHFLNKNKKEV